MATELVEAISIVDAKIWRGGIRAVVSDIDTPPASFPVTIEDIINPLTYALASGWLDFVATNEDGASLTREWDDVEGIATDQRSYNLREGGVQNARMAATMTSLYTDIDTMAYLWQFSEVDTVAAVVGPPAKAAHKRTFMGSPTAVVERFVALIQQNDQTNKLRAWVFRKGRLATPGELALNGRNPSRNQFTFRFLPDPAITDGSDFGKHFELT